jgi:hypothetical protein
LFDTILILSDSSNIDIHLLLLHILVHFKLVIRSWEVSSVILDKLPAIWRNILGKVLLIQYFDQVLILLRLSDGL